MRDIYLWTGPKDEAGRSRSGGDPDFEAAVGPRLIRPLPGSLVTDVGADALWVVGWEEQLTTTLSLIWASQPAWRIVGPPRCSRRGGGA